MVETTFTDLLPARLQPVASVNSVDDIFSGLTTCEIPKVSETSKPDEDIFYGLDGLSAKDKRREEKKYFYELDDPNADLIETIQKRLEEEDRDEARKERDRLVDKAFATFQREQEELKARRISMARDAIVKKGRKFICVMCARVHSSEAEMREHVDRAHLGILRQDFTERCDECGRGFKRAHHLRRHIEQQHNKTPLFKRARKATEDHSTTSKSASTPTSPELVEPSLKRARLTAGEDMPPIYTPSAPSSGPSAVKSLPCTPVYSPRLICVDSRNRVLLPPGKECPYCGQSFAWPQSRNRHIEQKHPERVGEKEAFVRPRDLLPVTPSSTTSSASAASTGSNKSRSVLDKSCAFCGQDFASCQSRDRHIDRKHKEEKEKFPELLVKTFKGTESPDLPFACQLCGKRFASQASQKTHVKRIHEEDGCAFECEQCDKRFPLASELKKHVRRVHEKVEEDSETGDEEASKIEEEQAASADYQDVPDI